MEDLIQSLSEAGSDKKGSYHFTHISFTFIISLNQCGHTIYFPSIEQVLPCFFSKMPKIIAHNTLYLPLYAIHQHWMTATQCA